MNLLPKDSFEKSVLGKVMEWALGVGKWIVIVTQLVVVGAFLMRFGLDRKLTNVRNDMQKEVDIILSYKELENDFVLAQKRISFIAPVVKRQAFLVSIVDELARSTPLDVWYERITINPASISLTGNANSIAGFSRFLNTIKRNGFFESIKIGNIESGTEKGSQIKFEIVLGYEEIS